MLKYLKRKQSNEEEDSDNEAGPSTGREVSEKKKCRQYSDSYLAMGFTVTGVESCPIPMCVVCGKKLSNEGMVPSKLKRHFLTNHGHLSGKSTDYFQRLLNSQKKQQQIFEKTVKVSEKAQEASFLVAQLVAQKMKSHTVAESLIMPACKLIVRSMLGKEAEMEIEKVPLSNNTISRRVSDMSSDIEQVLAEKLQNTAFALQVDESTDITNKCHLLAFVRFVNEGEIIEDFCCCKELPQTTKGLDIFNTLSSYLDSRSLSWSHCVGICTDGAPSMVGSIKGFVTLVKEKNPKIITTHCFLHREVLVSKTLGPALKEVLDVIIEMVNFIKQRPLQSRIFSQLCEDMQKDHVTLLQHTDVRWLSRGKVLSRVFELREELLVFFKNSNKAKFTSCLEDNAFVQKLAYLASIYQHINTLNTSMQGPKENMLTATDKLLAFKKKLNIWEKRLSSASTEMFPLLSQVASDSQPDEEVVALAVRHLKSLSVNLDHYFPSLSSDIYDWIRNPFAAELENADFTLQEEEQINELRCDRTLKMKFSEVPLDVFWLSIQIEYPAICKKAVNVLLQFSTSYLCEQAFSCLTNIKSKQRNRLSSVEDDLRVCLSKIRPQIQLLCKKKQAQVSH